MAFDTADGAVDRSFPANNRRFEFHRCIFQMRSCQPVEEGDDVDKPKTCLEALWNSTSHLHRFAMKKPFSKIAIVTGASRGIGAAISRRLAADGFGVIINYAASADAAESLATEIEKAGSRALAVKADVSDPVAVKTMFDTAEREFGGADVLVNNAGIMLLSPLAETTDELFDRQIAINLKGVFNGMREASKRLRSGASPPAWLAFISRRMPSMRRQRRVSKP